MTIGEVGKQAGRDGAIFMSVVIAMLATLLLAPWLAEGVASFGGQSMD